METFVSKPPQTEEDERACLIFEMGWLTSAVHTLTDKLPAVIMDIFDRGEGIDLEQMPTLHIADFCNEMRAEFAAAGGDPEAIDANFPWKKRKAN